MEEDIKILENMLNKESSIYKRNRRGNKEIKFEVNSNYYNAIENLIAGYKQLEEENKELLEVKISASANNRIMKLEEENKSKQKAYDDCYCEYKHYKQFDSIPKSKLKDIIDRIDYDIKKTKEIISKNTNIYASYRKNDYQIVRLRAMNTKSLDIKNRLQKLLESEE